jgi:phosphoglycolate phosphatase
MSKPTDTVRRYKAAIFDFDGVLCDSLSVAMDVFNEVRDREFPDLPRVSSRDDMAVVYAGSLRTCLDRWIGPDGTKRFFDEHSAAMQSKALDLATFPGIGTLLSSLPEKSVSIVSSAYGDAVRIVLDRDPGFDPRCLWAIAGREFRETKTKKIRAILSGRGLSPEDAVYIGDLESDILYCRDVPIDIVAVGYGYHPPEHLAKCNPTYRADSVEELGRLLRELIRA